MERKASIRTQMIEGLENCFESFSKECQELCLYQEVTEKNKIPTPLDFYRNWVSPNIPVIFRNAVSHWDAIRKWSNDYLKSKIGSKMVTVAVTPTGYADAVHDQYFVMPDEKKMPFGNFVDILEEHTSTTGIYYIQKQNSNLLDEFQELLIDVESDISWASEALAKKPDAVNFWMGDKRAVTSMHRDHYENLYCVIRGQKDFILLPPTDLPWVPYRNYQAATYKECEGKFEIMEEKPDCYVPWIPIDPENPDLINYPQYRNARPLSCSVYEGDVLYLPSLWFHHVRQSHGCIAVNYWYDMEFEVKYTYYKFLENVVSLHRKISQN